MDRVPMTQQGYDQLKAQLDKLKNEELPRIQKALGDAREMGDLSENAEFDAAREEMWRVDRRILELEDQLARATVVNASKFANGEITLGVTVQCEDLDFSRKDEFVLVGEGERREGIDTVSVASPLGQALVGRRVGDVIEIKVPRGKLRYKIVDVRTC
ncbi:MAG: transcription elongation factor GreA [Planctomycetes bacterium]|nr:transcription elongation factor GreA [Planctomycetota bacterium]